MRSGKAVQSCRQSDNEADSTWFSTDCSEDIERGKNLGITEIPDSMSEYKQSYCKYTKVVAQNGKPIHIFAQNEISNEQLIVARDLLAFYPEDVPGSEYGADKSEIANKMVA